jgi:hypothetical protein
MHLHGFANEHRQATLLSSYTLRIVGRGALTYSRCAAAAASQENQINSYL